MVILVKTIFIAFEFITFVLESDGIEGRLTPHFLGDDEYE